MQEFSNNPVHKISTIYSSTFYKLYLIIVGNIIMLKNDSFPSIQIFVKERPNNMPPTRINDCGNYNTLNATLRFLSKENRHKKDLLALCLINS